MTKEDSREQVAKELRIAEARAQDLAYKRGFDTEKAAADRRKDREEEIRD
jgi:hypothetical protein